MVYEKLPGDELMRATNNGDPMIADPIADPITSPTPSAASIVRCPPQCINNWRRDPRVG